MNLPLPAIKKLSTYRSFSRKQHTQPVRKSFRYITYTNKIPPRLDYWRYLNTWLISRLRFCHLLDFCIVILYQFLATVFHNLYPARVISVLTNFTNANKFKYSFNPKVEIQSMKIIFKFND